LRSRFFLAAALQKDGVKPLQKSIAVALITLIIGILIGFPPVALCLLVCMR